MINKRNYFVFVFVSLLLVTVTISCQKSKLSIAALFDSKEISEEKELSKKLNNIVKEFMDRNLTYKNHYRVVELKDKDIGKYEVVLKEMIEKHSEKNYWNENPVAGELKSFKNIGANASYFLAVLYFHSGRIDESMSLFEKLAMSKKNDCFIVSDFLCAPDGLYGDARAVGLMNLMHLSWKNKKNIQKAREYAMLVDKEFNYVQAWSGPGDCVAYFDVAALNYFISYFEESGVSGMKLIEECEKFDNPESSEYVKAYAREAIIENYINQKKYTEALIEIDSFKLRFENLFYEPCLFSPSFYIYAVNKEIEICQTIKDLVRVKKAYEDGIKWRKEMFAKKTGSADDIEQWNIRKDE